MNDCVYISGGHVWYDRRTQEWVALSYVRVLGRFADKKDALKAVADEVERYKEPASA